MYNYDPSFPVFSIAYEGVKQMAARRSGTEQAETSVNTQIALMGQDILYIRSDLGDVKGDIKELRNDMKDIRKEMRTDFRLIFTAIFALGGILGGFMGRGFGWF